MYGLKFSSLYDPSDVVPATCQVAKKPFVEYCTVHDSAPCGASHDNCTEAFVTSDGVNAVTAESGDTVESCDAAEGVNAVAVVGAGAGELGDATVGDEAASAAAVSTAGTTSDTGIELLLVVSAIVWCNNDQTEVRTERWNNPFFRKQHLLRQNNTFNILFRESSKIHIRSFGEIVEQITSA